MNAAAAAATATNNFLHSVVAAEQDDEGPQGADLLAGDGTMGGDRGELRPPVGRVGHLAGLVPHLQEPGPAATLHEHRSSIEKE